MWNTSWQAEARRSIAHPDTAQRSRDGGDRELRKNIMRESSPDNLPAKPSLMMRPQPQPQPHAHQAQREDCREIVPVEEEEKKDKQPQQQEPQDAGLPVGSSQDEEADIEKVQVDAEVNLVSSAPGGCLTPVEEASSEAEAAAEADSSLSSCGGCTSAQPTDSSTPRQD